MAERTMTATMIPWAGTAGGLRPTAVAAVLLLLLASLAPQECGAQPQLLRVLDKGFVIRMYATVPNARSLAVVKDGSATITYVGSRSSWGGELSDVYAVVDKDSNGVVDHVTKLIVGVNTPSGIAWRDNRLYFSGWLGAMDKPELWKGAIWYLDGVNAYALQNMTYSAATLLTDKLPNETYHGWRYLAFDARGRLLVTVGVPCNTCDRRSSAEGIEFGTIYAINVTTGRFKKIASGVRNSVGMEVHPDTGHLYFTDNGRDLLGDNVPDDELNRLVRDGQDYGFPYCLTKGTGDPWARTTQPGRPLNDPEMNADGAKMECKARGSHTRAVQALGPHTASLGLKFYRWFPGANFPQSYDRMLFVVQRGSWNREEPIGYRVITLRVNATTAATSDLKEFVVGWLTNPRTPEASSWGRPADIAQLPDGSMVVSDDTSGLLYRIRYFVD